MAVVDHSYSARVALNREWAGARVPGVMQMLIAGTLRIRRVGRSGDLFNGGLNGPAREKEPTKVKNSLRPGFVLGLQKQDFHLFEDGTEQTIAHFSGEDAPLSIGLVFDTSGSMGDKLRTSRQVALRFLTTMNAQDEAFLIQFSDRAELAVGFTSQIEEIQNSRESCSIEVLPVCDCN